MWKRRAKVSVEGTEAPQWQGVDVSIEPLEERRVLTAVNGTAFDDYILVSINTSNQLTVNVNGTIVLTNPTSVEIYGLGGKDTIQITSAVTMGIYVEGGANGDAITGGSGNDTLFGGDGADYIEGNAGDDQLYGEGDSDELHGGTGDDYIDGGADNDNIHGDDNSDTLVGGSGADYVYGDAGNDYFGDNTDGAVDHLFGGDDRDSVSGFDYNDVMDGIEDGTD